MANGKAYLIGGRGIKKTDIYDPVTREWSIGKSTPIELHHMQCVAVDDKIYLMSPWTGPYPYETSPPNAYAYDTTNDTWITLNALPEARLRGSAAVVVSHDKRKIYVSHGNIGGHETGDHALSLGWLDEYDIATGQWTAISDSAPNPRDHTGGAMLNGRLCVTGGRIGGDQYWPDVAPTDCYNFQTGMWEVEASIPQVRAGSSYGITCDGRLMVAGGEGNGKAWNNVDVFDGKQWETISSLKIGRHGSGLAVE